MFKEFKEFAVKGNVVDMAVGIIIGGAFGTIVKSLVSDVIMPPIGRCWEAWTSPTCSTSSAAAGPSVADRGAGGGSGHPQLRPLHQQLISFLIVAFAVFLLVRAVNSLRQKEEAAPPRRRSRRPRRSSSPRSATS